MAAVAIPVSKPCPKCFSEKSTLVPMKGLEKFFAGKNDLKKYQCLDCGHAFQAADRRRVPRTGRGVAVEYRRT
jgi:hypothetical protein